MTPPPGLQVYLEPRTTSAFDFLTPKVDYFAPLPHGPLVPTGIKICSFCFQNIVFTSLIRDEQMDARTGRQHLPPSASASLAWCRQKKL